MSGTVAAVVAVVAAVAAAVAAGLSIAALSRARRASASLEQEIDEGKARFDAVIAQEAEAQARELEDNLALARSRAISELADEERRIVEERRRDIAEREREATGKLAAQLTDAQRAVRAPLRRLGRHSSRRSRRAFRASSSGWARGTRS